jgi:DMSO/TMAO reductase YedYZ molybdopterin-dependent catalytic subunit
MEQTTEDLPIACVEGWSAMGTWTGVRLADLVRAVGAPVRSRVFLRSLQQGGSFSTSELPAEFVEDPLTLLALSLSGEPLDLDHGFPCRLIAPARPGVMQTKWLHRIEVLS